MPVVVGQDEPHEEPPAAPGHRRMRRGVGRAAVIWTVVGTVLAGGAAVAAGYALSDGGGRPPAAVAASSGLPSAEVSATPELSPSATSPALSPSATRSSATSSRSPGPSPSSTSPSPSPSASTCPDGSADGNDIPDPDSQDPSKLKHGAAPAFQLIKTAMAGDGIQLVLTSGYRSWAHQQELWNTEVQRCGSAQAARHRVLPPDESSHVKGIAIDIAPRAAQVWLQQNGSQFGWCRMYDDETWHFEYNPSYKNGCPAMKPQP